MNFQCVACGETKEKTAHNQKICPECKQKVWERTAKCALCGKDLPTLSEQMIVNYYAGKKRLCNSCAKRVRCGASEEEIKVNPRRKIYPVKSGMLDRGEPERIAKEYGMTYGQVLTFSLGFKTKEDMIAALDKRKAERERQKKDAFWWIK